MEFMEVVSKLEQMALDKGATSAKLISTDDIYVEYWVRQKCQYGCGGYARHFTCPPYSPTPEETRKRLQGYNRSLLIEFTGMKAGEKRPSVHEVMYELEREAFLNGLYKSFAYSAGPCRLCENCAAQEIKHPSEFDKRECRDQRRARPAMEACGIDVYQTARKAGYHIDVVRNSGDCYKRFGLLLLD